MSNPDRPFFTRRDFLKMLGAGAAAWTVKLLWPSNLSTGDQSVTPDSETSSVNRTDQMTQNAVAMGHIDYSNSTVILNSYPDGTISTAGPFPAAQTSWPIYPRGRIIAGAGDNQLLVPVSKPDGKGRYTEIDIRYFTSIDGDPVGEVPLRNNSWIGIGGNWPVEAFSAVENLGVGFIRVNRSNPLFKETLARAKTRGMKTIFTYDLNFAERLYAAGGYQQLKTLMDWELREVAQNYQPAMVEISNEPDFNSISPQMYAKLFTFATDAFGKTAFAPKLLAASIRPDHLENYFKELLKLNLIPWAHDIHAYQNPNAISDVYNQTLAVFKKYPQFHRDHLVVLEWGISGIGSGHGNKNQIIDGVKVALGLNLPVALHQFFNADGEDFGIYNPAGFGGMKPSVDAYLFKQFVKQTPRPAQPDDWL